MNKKITASLLALFMLMSASCGTAAGGNDTNAGDTSVADGNTEAAETQRSQTKDNLPQKDYGGKKFTILYRNEWAYEFAAEEQNGDIMNDAIFARNTAVEDRFNIKFNMVGLPGTYDNAEYKNAVNNSVLAGDSDYDLITGYQANMITPAMEGYFMNVYEVPHLDLDQPWWSEQCNNSITVNGKCFMTTGDIALTLWDNMYVFYYNKLLAEEYKMPDLYQLVRDGKWTLDKFSELSMSVGRDLNGDTVYTEDDMFGFITASSNHMRAWMVACETPITRQNNDGLMEACFVCERSITMIEKLLTLHQSTSTLKGYNINKEPYYENDPVVFTSDRALFMSGFLSNASALRNMATDFGILPYPMFDENQDGYRTTAHNSVSMICFPVTLKDVDMSGMIAEALCAESYRNVIPKYYDVSLKAKEARDEESGEMIDIIRDGLIFDFGWVHSVPMGSIGTIVENMILQNTSDLASYWASKESSVIAGLNKINAAYAKN